MFHSKKKKKHKQTVTSLGRDSRARSNPFDQHQGSNRNSKPKPKLVSSPTARSVAPTRPRLRMDWTAGLAAARAGRSPLVRRCSDPPGAGSWNDHQLRPSEPVSSRYPSQGIARRAVARKASNGWKDGNRDRESRRRSLHKTRKHLHAR